MPYPRALYPAGLYPPALYPPSQGAAVPTTAPVPAIWWFLGRRPAPAAPPVPADLLGAVVALIEADPVLGPATLGTADDAGGHRVYTGGIPEGGMADPATGTTGVAVAVVEVSALPDYNTSPDYIDSVTVQVSVFVPDDPDLARSLGKRAAALLAPYPGRAPLAFADGADFLRLRGQARLAKDPGKGPRGRDIWHQSIDITFLVTRTLATP